MPSLHCNHGLAVGAIVALRIGLRDCGTVQAVMDFMNGAIARLGRQFGIPTPVNDTLVNLIRFKTGNGRNGA